MTDILDLANRNLGMITGVGSGIGPAGDAAAMSREAQQERERRMAPLLTNVPLAQRYLPGWDMNAYRRPNPTPLPVRLAALDAGIAAFKDKRANSER